MSDVLAHIDANLSRVGPDTEHVGKVIDDDFVHEHPRPTRVLARDVNLFVELVQSGAVLGRQHIFDLFERLGFAKQKPLRVFATLRRQQGQLDRCRFS